MTKASLMRLGDVTLDAMLDWYNGEMESRTVVDLIDLAIAEENLIIEDENGTFKFNDNEV